MDQSDDDESNAFLFEATLKNNETLIIEDNPECPFKMWNLYFPKERFKEQSDAQLTVDKFLEFVESLKETFDINQIKKKGYFNLDFKDLCTNKKLLQLIPEFENDFGENPEFYLNCFGLAMHQFMIKKYSELYEKFRTEKLRNRDLLNSSLASGADYDIYTESDIDYSSELSSFKDPNEMPIKVRLLNYLKTTKIKHLKANMYNKYVNIRGTVVKVSPAEPLVVRMAFECQKCNSTFQVAFVQGKYKCPTRCANKTCNSKIFAPLQHHHMTKTVDCQTLKLQEIIQGQRDYESGRIPRTIDCELTEDLTDTCRLGDLVTINGVVKAMSLQTAGAGKSNRDKCTFVFYIYANSIQEMLTSQQDDSAAGKKSNNLEYFEFLPTDLECFKEIQQEPDPFKTIVNSLCPFVFGHELVKAGLILGLFGGSKRDINDFAVRSNAHVLVVGDPGLAKSQLLKACANLSPKGNYVCGSATTTAGLTVSLENKGSEFLIDSGALMQAHNGCCCIDEFDKIKEQKGLQEVMEQQCISIAKGGFVCTFPCKTTVLAAANPIQGHYDKSKTVSENIKMDGPLLSRFDLLFILLDKPNEDFDRELSSHILALHSKQPGSVMMQSGANMYNVQSASMLDADPNFKKKLVDKLRINRGEDFDPILHPLLRKYIMFAKQTCDPKIGNEAANELKSFWTEWRQNTKNSSNQCTIRQLEALIRLTQARAKCELRTLCTVDDAREVIEITKASMVDYNENELGMLDFTKSLKKSGKNKSNFSQSYLDELQNMAKKKGSNMFSEQELKNLYESISRGNEKKSFEQHLDQLNARCYLLLKPNKNYELNMY